MPAGRPKKDLTDEQIQQIEKLAGYGLNEDLIADFFGMGDETLRARMKEDPVIMRAYKKGRAVRISEVSFKLQENIDKGDQASIFFYLKTQARWSETVKQEISGPDGGPVQVQTGLDLSKLSLKKRKAMLAILAAENE